MKICHTINDAPFHLVPLSSGATTWNEEQSRQMKRPKCNAQSVTPDQRATLNQFTFNRFRLNKPWERCCTRPIQTCAGPPGSDRLLRRSAGGLARSANVSFGCKARVEHYASDIHSRAEVADKRVGTSASGQHSNVSGAAPP
jgi:hypothetical protein